MRINKNEADMLNRKRRKEIITAVGILVGLVIVMALISFFG